MNNSEIGRSILEEGLDDWVPIDRIIDYAKEGPEGCDGRFKERSLDVIESLLLRNAVRVGEIGDSGFEAWEGGVVEIINRVVSALNAANWQPYGGVCWLCNTSIGDEEVRTPRPN